MTSIVARIARALPKPECRQPLEEPEYLDVAGRVADIFAVGRANELQAFFEALETAYIGPLDEADSNALSEGLMESILFSIDHLGIDAQSVYSNLLPHSRHVWEDVWPYVHDSPWPSA